jgi:hypothetical protein
VLIDYEKACDKVDENELCDQMADRGLLQHMIISHMDFIFKHTNIYEVSELIDVFIEVRKFLRLSMPILKRKILHLGCSVEYKGARLKSVPAIKQDRWDLKRGA